MALLSVALVSITALAFALVSWQWRRAETEAAAEAAAHAEARQAHREALEEEAQLALNHGLDLCEQGEIGRGLLWLARSLELTTEAKVDRLDRAIRINLADWSSRLSRPLGRLRHRAPIRDLAFRPDGRMLVSAGEDGTVRTWDTATWQEAAPPPWAEVHPSGTGRIVGPIALNPREGRMLVAFDGEGRGLFWDIERRRRMGPILEHPSRTAVGAVVFSPDGRQLVTSGSDGMARRWDVATCRPIGEALRHGGVGITSLASVPTARRWSPEAKTDGPFAGRWPRGDASDGCCSTHPSEKSPSAVMARGSSPGRGTDGCMCGTRSSGECPTCRPRGRR